MSPFTRGLRRVFCRPKAERGDQGDTEEPSGPEESPITTFSDSIGPLTLRDDCEGPDTGFDIVFIHGLRGSRVKTWSRGDVLWPRDLLKDDLKNVRVITWGYDANIANAFTYSSKDSLFGHSSTLLNDLAMVRQEITRPIIFVCHSLGGLVAKEALITSASYKTHGRHSHLGNIYSSTVGVIFMGTPHRGSAKVSYGEIAAKIAGLTLRQPNRQLLETLKQGSAILDQQRDGFTTISNNMIIVCIREELPTGIGLIVPEYSASYDGFKVARDAIHANHMDMVKFSGKNMGYARTLGHIQNIMKAKSSKTHHDQKQHKFLRNIILEGLVFPGIDDREEEIDKAYADTCSWIWGSQRTSDKTPARPSDFISWLRSTKPLLWISGKAGCGKSTLMKHICQDSRTEPEVKQSWANNRNLIILRYFFYEMGNNKQKSREGMLRSMLLQILKMRRDLIPCIYPELFIDANSSRNTDETRKLPTDFLRWQKLSNCLISTLDQLKDSRILIFLDGLDEYRMADKEDHYTEEELDLIYDGDNEDETWGRSKWITDGHKEVAKFICELTKRENVKLCVASRELLAFEHQFRDFPRIRVHEQTANAIAKYCSDRLKKEAPDLVDLPKLISTINSKALGVFLWVRFVVDMLVDGYANGDNSAELWEVIEKLPSRLGGRNGLYMRMIRNINPRYFQESRRIFQLSSRLSDSRTTKAPFDIIALFLAEEGYLHEGSDKLRVSRDKYDFRTWDEWKARWSNLHKRLKSRCGGLLEGTEDVRFMHRTARQFISRKYLWADMFGDAVGFTSNIDMDLALISGLIRRIKCQAEAVVPHSCGEPVHALDEGADPYAEAEPSCVIESTTELIEGIMSLGLKDREQSGDSSDNYFAQLLDELDLVGKQITHDFRTPRGIPASTWPRAFLVERERETTTNFGIRITNIWDFALSRGFHWYVEIKVRNRQISKSELSLILLKSALMRAAHWRSTQDGMIPRPSPEATKALLQEGADPNSQVKLPNTSEVWTSWTRFLEETYCQSPDYCDYCDFMDSFIAITKLFLENGADPAARWSRSDGSGIGSPELAFTALLDRVKKSTHVISGRFGPEYIEDLNGLLELLRRAKGETSWNTEEDWAWV
ncbi:hypothetical protein F4777DRAFT_555820 [Nemania sp. FL0916]|nr:hypothetical protein F4777DRAFT_555820 [Nemania sp. FL0916]